MKLLLTLELCLADLISIGKGKLIQLFVLLKSSSIKAGCACLFAVARYLHRNLCFIRFDCWCKTVEAKILTVKPEIIECGGSYNFYNDFYNFTGVSYNFYNEYYNFTEARKNFYNGYYNFCKARNNFYIESYNFYKGYYIKQAGYFNFLLSTGK